VSHIFTRFNALVSPTGTGLQLVLVFTGLRNVLLVHCAPPPVPNPVILEILLSIKQRRLLLTISGLNTMGGVRLFISCSQSFPRI
jgi:hypothetical protein